MSLKKTILIAFAGWVCCFAYSASLASAARPSPKAGSVVGDARGFHPYPLPWVVTSKDSSALYFAAFLTLPDSVAGLATEAWLDTAKPTSQSLAIYMRQPLAEDEKQLLVALRALLRMDWLDAMLAHREALARGPQAAFLPQLSRQFGALIAGYW